MARRYKFNIRLPLNAILLGAIAATSLPIVATAQEVVNIYSSRQEALIRPLLDQFTANTGIEVAVVSGKDDALFERLQSEGANSPADVLLTADVGRLYRAKNAGVLQAVDSATLESSIPAQYRDSQGFWFGLSMRSRVIYYHPDRVDAAELSSYEDLADSKWRGRICIRSSTNVYNQSLMGSLIAHLGADASQAWAAAIVANMARDPSGGDRDQIAAVAAGECDVAVGNTYYFGGMLNGSDEQKAQAGAVRLFWPNQDGRGAHVNISGGAITKNAPNRDNALRLLEYLSSTEAQKMYAEVNYEYPVRDGVSIDGTLAGFGTFKADSISLEVFAANQPMAVQLFDRVGWR